MKVANPIRHAWGLYDENLSTRHKSREERSTAMMAFFNGADSVITLIELGYPVTELKEEMDHFIELLGIAIRRKEVEENPKLADISRKKKRAVK